MTEQAVSSHFLRTSEEPSDREYAMIKCCDYEWYRPGEPVMEVIGNLLETHSSVANDIQQILEEKHSDLHHEEVGVETDFSTESYYAERRKVSTGRLDSMWATFITSLK